MHCAPLFLLFLVKCYLFFNAQLKILSIKTSQLKVYLTYLFFQNLLHYSLCSGLNYYISTILSNGLCINTFVCSYGNVPFFWFVFLFDICIKHTKRIDSFLWRPKFLGGNVAELGEYTTVVLPITQNHYIPNQIPTSMLLSIIIMW